MGDGLPEKLFDRDAITAHKERASRPERRREGSDAGMSLWRPPALDFDRHEPTPRRPVLTTKSTNALSPFSSSTVSTRPTRSRKSSSASFRRSPEVSSVIGLKKR